MHVYTTIKLLWLSLKLVLNWKYESQETAGLVISY